MIIHESTTAAFLLSHYDPPASLTPLCFPQTRRHLKELDSKNSQAGSYCSVRRTCIGVIRVGVNARLHLFFVGRDHVRIGL